MLLLLLGDIYTSFCFHQHLHLFNKVCIVSLKSLDINEYGEHSRHVISRQLGSPLPRCHILPLLLNRFTVITPLSIQRRTCQGTLPRCSYLRKSEWKTTILDEPDPSLPNNFHKTSSLGRRLFFSRQYTFGILIPNLQLHSHSRDAF